MNSPHTQDTPRTVSMSALAIFFLFFRLGLTSFGGPAAHLSFFRQEFVTKKRWLDDGSYAELMALCQCLPGPGSSQVGIAIGSLLGGYRGGVCAWLGFTLPSALIMTILALGIASQTFSLPNAVVQSLKVCAVAVVIQAVYGMAKHFCQTRITFTLMIASCCFTLVLPGFSSLLIILLIATLVGITCLPAPPPSPHRQILSFASPRAGSYALMALLLVLIGLYIGTLFSESLLLQLADSFYRIGCLIFGGGHVVLPMLQSEVVDTGLLDLDTFLAGYGAAQALPGPLFTFSAYIGASIPNSPILAAVICLTLVFLPSFFLVWGLLPYWEKIRYNLKMQQTIAGINAAMVGLLAAALYQPIWQHTVLSVWDVCWVLLTLLALETWRLPVVGVVAGNLLAAMLYVIVFS
ncbi:MAG: chromate efflux transporter [Pseudomonadota bacterium]